MHDEDTLITDCIELNPDKPGLDRARIKEHGVAVWALVAYYQAAGGDINRVAADYEIPAVYVEAALAYYKRHQTLLDARIAINGGECSCPAQPRPYGSACA
jgi:uncharacterized protein (DUF433 family)